MMLFRSKMIEELRSRMEKIEAQIQSVHEIAVAADESMQIQELRLRVKNAERELAIVIEQRNNLLQQKAAEIQKIQDECQDRINEYRAANEG